MADWGYVIAGFGATAAAVLTYVWRLERRIARLRKDRSGGAG